MTERNDPVLAQRLAARGVTLLAGNAAELAAECRTCHTRWQIPRVGVTDGDDAAADWWWCPNGCNHEA